MLVDEHSTSNKQPYLFNGKELDFETGLYYYGARYYDPKTSIFLNVDPLVEKTGTPYTYTYNNPIRYIDPTGMEAEDPPSKSLYEGQVYKDNTGVFIGGKDGIWKATRKDGTKEVLIPKVQLKGKSGTTMASEARQRYYDAIANCSGCQQIETFEKFLFYGVGSTNELVE